MPIEKDSLIKRGELSEIEISRDVRRDIVRYTRRFFDGLGDGNQMVWDPFHASYRERYPQFGRFLEEFYHQFKKIDIDLTNFDSYESAKIIMDLRMKEIYKKIQKDDAIKTLNLIEYIVRLNYRIVNDCYKKNSDEKRAKYHNTHIAVFIREINEIFQQNSINLTFIDNGEHSKITHHIPKQSKDDIEHLMLHKKNQTVKEHIQKAVDHSSALKPSYKGCINECCLAMEVFLKTLDVIKKIQGYQEKSAGQLLDDLLRLLKDKENAGHEALFEALKKFYGYASNTTRHGKADSLPDADYRSQARFAMSIIPSCINYLESELHSISEL